MFIANQETISSHDQVMSVMHNLSLLSFFPYLLGLYGNKELKTHSNRVANICLAISQEMGLSRQTQQRIYLGALLHDTGKLGISWAVLKKQGRLNDEEYGKMKTHTTMGYNFLKELSFNNIFHLAEIARDHHEGIGGNGYPNRLSADQISLETRIVSVVDKFEALTAERIYKPQYPAADAINLLRGEIQTKQEVDPEILFILEKLILENKLEPDLSVLKVQRNLLKEKEFSAISSVYRDEIIELLERIIQQSPHGYDTNKVRETVRKIASLLNLSKSDYHNLELAALIGGLGSLCLAKSDTEGDLTVDKILKNRKIILKESLELLEISPWFNEITPIIRYVFAYYDGNPEKSVYLGQPKTKEEIPFLSRVLAIIVAITNVNNNYKQRLKNLAGSYFDPELVALILPKL